MNETKTNALHIHWLPLLTLIFIILKVCNVITWSWVWVLAPTWMPLAFAAIILVIGLILESFNI